MDTTAQLIALAELVHEMRLCQIKYFRERSYSDLQKSKALEKRVDNVVAATLHYFNNEQTTQLEFNF